MGQFVRATAHLRQVCSLNLPLESLSTAISEALEPILGKTCMCFIVTSADGSTRSMWLDFPLPLPILNDYVSNYSGRAKQACLAVGQNVAMREYWGVRALPDWDDFHRSDCYHAVWKPGMCQ